MADLKVGDQAPDFELPRDGDGTVRLADLQGKPVVFYAYPKDDTSGCTAQAVDFTQQSEEFAALGAGIIGISPDPVKKHDSFKSKHDLSVTLISDEDKKTLQDYGVWKEKSMYGKKYMGVERSTFLIDGDGKIARVWRKVKVPGHVDEVLQALKAL